MSTIKSIIDLRLFPQVNTRDAYRQAFGQEPPPYDPTRAPKGWSDPSQVGPGNVTYAPGVIDPHGDPSNPYSPLTMSKSDARTVNLPGQYIAPAYVVAPTPAVYVPLAGGNAGAVDPRSLTSAEDAQALVTAIANDLQIQAVFVSPDPNPGGINWNGETRRRYAIQFMGLDAQNAGYLLLYRNQNGVNVPGSWVLQNENNEATGAVYKVLAWVSKPAPVVDPNSVTAAWVPVPCRALQSGESFERDQWAGLHVLVSDPPAAQSGVAVASIASPVAQATQAPGPDFAQVLTEIFSPSFIQQILSLGLTIGAKKIG